MKRRKISRATRLLALALSAAVAGCSSGGNGGGGDNGPGGGLPPSNGPAACMAGTAGNHSCSGISLRKRVSLAEMGGGSGNDLWGWVDPSAGKEYALMGLSNGVSFIDISDPENPIVVGRLPTQTNASNWRDIKVYQDHAFIVADAAGSHGCLLYTSDAADEGVEG